jgi:hypothetical protein
MGRSWLKHGLQGPAILGAGLKMTWPPLRAFAQFCLDFVTKGHVGSTHERAPGTDRGIVAIGTSAIVFAAAAAVGIVFAFAPPADARFMHQCSGKYQAAAKAGCGANAAKARPPLRRGITLGIGDEVSVTIFEPPGGLFVPSDASSRPGNFVTLPNQIVDSNGNITVPYAGTIPAAGRTPSEVQQTINEALRALPRYRSGK